MWILLELELQEVLSHFSWVLGNKLRSSEIAKKKKTKQKPSIQSLGQSPTRLAYLCFPLPPWQTLQLKH